MIIGELGFFWGIGEELLMNNPIENTCISKLLGSSDYNLAQSMDGRLTDRDTIMKTKVK